MKEIHHTASHLVLFSIGSARLSKDTNSLGLSACKVNIADRKSSEILIHLQITAIYVKHDFYLDQEAFIIIVAFR